MKSKDKNMNRFKIFFIFGSIKRQLRRFIVKFVNIIEFKDVIKEGCVNIINKCM